MILGFSVKQGIDNYVRKQKLGHERALALERRTGRFLSERSHLLGRIEVQAGVLAEIHNWQRSEVGFDQDQNENSRVLEAVQTGDMPFLRARAEQLKNLRPRDAFVYGGSAELRAIEASSAADDHGNDEIAAMFKAAAMDYVRAAQLIPAAPFYDGQRAEYVLLAASNASNALYYSQTRSEFPVSLANTALQFRPRDHDGRIRRVKAFAHASTGPTDGGQPG